jgi:O-antigen/teichoic acid export membrane protein
MTILVAAGDRPGALQVFQSTFVLIGSVAAAMIALSSALVWFLPLNTWFGLSELTTRETSIAFVLLAAYVVVALFGPMLLGGYRCEGNFPTGMLLTSILRFADNAALIVALAFGARPAAAAAAYLGTRCVGQYVFYRVMRSKSPWIQVGWRHATVGSLRRLLRPAMAFMAVPVGNALILQGAVVVIGAVLGAVPVVVFSTLRTMTRSSYQATEIIRATVWSEFSTAFGVRNYALARRLHRFACQATLWFCTFSTTALLVAGPWVYRVWTHDRVPMNSPVFWLLLVAALANSFWYTSSVALLATNTHERFAVVYLGSTALSLSLCYFILIPWLGLSGAVIGLLTADLITGFYVLRRSLALVKDRAADFLLAMFKPGPILSEIWRSVRPLAGYAAPQP